MATNIFDGKYNQISATIDAAKIMHLVACLLTDKGLDQDDSEYKGNDLKAFKAINDKQAFTLIKRALALLNKNGII